ncbi:MAG TPA: hypothetical protein VFA07_07485 [Chthonomonadaceae bacterium]|nr:hypothetical protein [Chthonomonadaceae bacterium]
MPQVKLPPKREVVKTALIASTLAGGVLAARLLTGRKDNPAQRFTEALFATERLREATQQMAETPERMLAACAAYLLDVAYHSSEGLRARGGAEDAIGKSRTRVHPYTHVAATVLTEALAPEHVLTYAVTIPEVGEVRGTRRVGGLHISGHAPARPLQDTAQVTLEEGYTAQLESELEIGEYLVTGRTRLFGQMTLRDNRDNVGRLHIGYDGTVSGTITRNARVIGRFEGRVADGLQFKQYQIESR